MKRHAAKTGQTILMALTMALLTLPATTVIAQPDPVSADASESALSASVAEAVALDKKLKGREPGIKLDILRVKSLLSGEKILLDKESKEIDELKPSMDKKSNELCQGEVPTDQLESARKSCHALIDPWNKRIDDYEARATLFNNEMEKLQKRLQAYSDDMNELARKKRAILAQAKTLALRMVADCLQRCTSSSDEDAAQCQQTCWDGAQTRINPILAPLGLRVAPNT